MGIIPSKPSYILTSPAESIRLCPGFPGHCWCGASKLHRTSRYVYVEYSRDGRERYSDPVDLLGDFLLGQSTRLVPWKATRDWSARDYERLGEVLNEYCLRQGSCGAATAYPGIGFQRATHSPIPPAGEYGRRERRQHPTWSDWEALQDELAHRMRRMEERCARHIEEREGVLFGTESGRKREQYRADMLRTFREILPQLNVTMINQQQQDQRQPRGCAIPAPGMTMTPSGSGTLSPLFGGGMAGRMPAVAATPDVRTAMNPLVRIGSIRHMNITMDAREDTMGGSRAGYGSSMNGWPVVYRGRNPKSQLAFLDDDDDEFGIRRPRYGGFRGRSRWDDEDML